MMITTQPRKNDPNQTSRLQALEEFNNDLKTNSTTVKKNKKKTNKTAEAITRVGATDLDFAEGPKGNALKTKTDTRAKQTEIRQRAARDAVIDLKRKRERPAAAKVTAEEELMAAIEDDGLDLSDLSYEQIEALKKYGGLTGNMTREQVNEIINRVSPLTEDGTPFVISTPAPKKRFLPPRRLKVKDITTGKEIVL
jgi:ABC-type transporter Mla subunit MlaD